MAIHTDFDRILLGWISSVRLQGANGDWRCIIARVEHDMLAEFHLQMIIELRVHACHASRGVAIDLNSIH